VLRVLEIGQARSCPLQVSKGPSRISLPGISPRLALVSALVLCFLVFGSIGVRAQSIAAPAAADQATTQAQTEARQSYHAGISQARQGHLDEAIQTFKKGLESDPKNLVLVDAIGADYSLRGDLEQA